jgi:hypothetical protein
VAVIPGEDRAFWVLAFNGAHQKHVPRRFFVKSEFGHAILSHLPGAKNQSIVTGMQGVLALG